MQQPQPEIQRIANLTLSHPAVTRLDNGIPVYTFNLGDQEVSRVDIVIEGGRCDGNNQMESELISALLREGTQHQNARTIAEHLDYYGSWLGANASSHNVTISLYAVNKYFDRVIPTIADIIRIPSFPEHELGNLKSLALTRLRTNNEKVAYLSGVENSKLYFGTEHNLGKPTTPEMIERISREELSAFHSDWFGRQNVAILISGTVTDDMIASLNRHLGTDWNESTHSESGTDAPACRFTAQRSHIDKPNALQSALRIAIPTVGRSHADYIPLRILTTAFGGYFGSRLMTNIREDKGYTYSISASLLGMRHNSQISIGCQCDNSYTNTVIDEIVKEMEHLKAEPLGMEELNRVKSYMLSDLARTLDTPFSVADFHLSMLSNRIPADYFDNQVRLLGSITPEELQAMAVRYFDTDNMLITIAGNMEAVNAPTSAENGTR